MATLGNGNDSIDGTSGNDLLDGQGGSDTLHGLAGNDTLLGGIGYGDDYLDGGSGTDRMEGGAGEDTYVMDSASDLVVELFGQGVDTVLTSVSYALSANVENSTVNGAQDATLYGNDLNNVLTGGAGNNRLWAGAGNDTVLGGDGNDDLAGGLGNDSLVGGEGGDMFRPGLGHDTVDGSQSGNAGFDILYVDYASVTAPVTMLSGVGIVDAGSNRIDFEEIDAYHVVSGRGNDLIETGSNNDVLDGGAGADTLAGGNGSDTYYLDSSGDKVIETPISFDQDTAYSSVSAVIPAYIEDFRLTGSAVRVIGNAQDNLAFATEGDNILWGGDGDDSLIGDLGSDDLSGGDGDDELHGDADYYWPPMPGGGNDTLTGGLGADTVTGGEGADVFRFRSSAEGGDRITDFSQADGDLIDLSWIDANTSLAGNQAFVFIGHSDYHHLAGELREGVTTWIDGSGDPYDVAYLAADTDGDGDSDFAIYFWDDTLQFSVADIIL